MDGKTHYEINCTIATHDLIFHRLRRLDRYQHVMAFRRQSRQGEKGAQGTTLHFRSEMHINHE